MENLEKIEDLKVEGNYSERFKKYCDSLDEVVTIAEKMGETTNLDLEQSKIIIAEMRQKMLELGASPDEVYQDVKMTPEEVAEHMPSGWLNLVASFTIDFIDSVASGEILPTVVDFNVNIGAVMEECKKAKKSISELCQDDYKGKFIISQKTKDFILKEYNYGIVMDFKEESTAAPVKKIGNIK